MDDIRDSERHGSASPTSNPPLPHDVNEGTSVPGRASPNVQATSAPAPSSETGGTPSSTETNHQAQSVTQQNDANHSLSTTGLGDSKDPLGEFDWNDLEVRFCAAMEGFKKIEDEISDEFKRWLDVFVAWASVATHHESDRAHKRLRTRMTWVQGAEKDLEEKRLHYVKVVKAFESALALLGGI